MGYTKVVDKDEFEGAEDHWACNDCGAHAAKQKDIKHHPTCVPGESEMWEEFYTKANEDEEGDSAMTVGSPGDDL